MAAPTEPESSSKATNPALLSPVLLARLLDRWALRREKILPLLDYRAAGRARALAIRCRALNNEAAVNGVLSSAKDWTALREEIVFFLENQRGSSATLARF